MLSPLRNGDILMPAGPSDTVMEGIPRRAIACVLPAAPGTFSGILSAGSMGGNLKFPARADVSLLEALESLLGGVGL